MRIHLKKLIISILIPLAVGGLSALLTRGNMESFDSINKPPLSPPAILFPIVWSVLFILMGIASYLIFVSPKTQQRKNALTLYAVQLIFNFFWSIIFFNLEAYLFAFIWIIALWILIIITAIKFYRISKPAGILMIPYILWVTFAAYLNLAIYTLN
ncbi:MAG: TspO/MBR family protein [Acutalibacteraceae bacterium]|nr:TspO/MBR family protein [Acutalibacteraceae bacterium]